MKKILYATLLFLTIIFIIILYAHFLGNTGIKTNEISYNTRNIAKSYNGLKIVHFSDLHYNQKTNKQFKKIVNEINKIKPDLVLFTGDLLDNKIQAGSKDITIIINELSKIKSIYGNYAIIGDCDYLKTDTLKNIYIQSNFTLLDNNYSIIHNQNNDQIFIGGVNSYNYEEANIDIVMDYFNKNKDIDFKIIMIHEGDYAKEITDKYQKVYGPLTIAFPCNKWRWLEMPWPWEKGAY